MEKKTITLVVVGTGKPTTKDVGIVKGTTLDDVKRTMKLDKKKSFTFVRKATGEQLNSGVDLFEILDDHEKVEVSAKAELGKRELSSLLISFFRRKRESNGTPVATPIEHLSLEEQLEHLGWRRVGQDYVGQISGMYPAELRYTWSGYKLFVQNPPSAVFSGPHKDCFLHMLSGWYFVHFREGAHSPLSMVRETERYFSESGGCSYA